MPPLSPSLSNLIVFTNDSFLCPLRCLPAPKQALDRSVVENTNLGPVVGGPLPAMSSVGIPMQVDELRPDPPLPPGSATDAWEAHLKHEKIIQLQGQAPTRNTP